MGICYAAKQCYAKQHPYLLQRMKLVDFPVTMELDPGEFIMKNIPIGGP